MPESSAKGSPAEYDLVIRCGTLLTLAEGEPGFVPKSDQLLAIKDAKIFYIGPWKSEGWKAKETIDASKKLVMPGLINAHSHLPMTLFRGLADDLPFNDWLHKNILPLEARLVSPDFVTIGTELALLEAFSSGTTTLLDMYYFEDAIADVVDKSGARAWVGECIIDYPVPDNPKKDGSDYRILDALRERYTNHERVTPFLAPHAPYSCSDDTLKGVIAYGQKHSLPVSIHVSETAFENETSQKTYGKSPVQRLHDVGLSKLPCVYAHTVHLSDDDIGLLAQDNVAVVHNPECNMKLASGAAPIPKLLKAGVTVGLGTDGPASNNDLNLFKEMDVAAKLQKFVNSDNTAMTAKIALRMATLGSARALKMDSKVGSLEAGKFADCLILDLNVPHMKPVHDLCSQLVYASTGHEVETVVVHGRVVLRNRVPTTIDAEALYGRIDSYRKKAGF